MVGDGFGSLIVYSTAVYLGFRPEEITIFGPGGQPGGDLSAVRVQPRADRVALGVRVALPPCGLAHLRGARGLVAQEPETTAAIGAAAIQPRCPGHPRRGQRRGHEAARLERQPLRHEGRLAAARGLERRLPAFRPLRRGGSVHRPRQARDARLRTRPLVLSTRAREGPAGSALADRIVQAYAPKTYDPNGSVHRHRLGDRLGQRVGERDRRGREVHLARPQPDAGRAGPEHAALLLRGARDRCLPGTRLRPADGVPRADPQGHCAASPRLGREDRDRSERGSLRADHRRDRRDRAGAARSARAHHEQARRRPGLARRHRRRHGHRVQQVRALGAAPAPADRVLQGADRGRPHEAAVQLRPAGARPARLALRRYGHPRERGDHPRRHDRRAEVHRAPLRRRLLRGREAEAAPLPVAARDAAEAGERDGQAPAPRPREEQLA